MGEPSYPSKKDRRRANKTRVYEFEHMHTVSRNLEQSQFSELRTSRPSLQDVYLMQKV